MITEAAVLVGPGQIEIQEFAVPEIGADEAIIEIESCGLCGSDVKPFFDGGGKVGGPRHITAPAILGHEIVGRIARVGGDAAARWRVGEGDRVVVERWLPCGRCGYCQNGQFPYCYRLRDGEQLYYGGPPTTLAPALWGGFARHMYLHPDSLVHRVSGEPPASVYSLFLPLANAIDWVLHTGQLGLGDDILIQGPGPIGLLCVLVAKAAGAQVIAVSGMPGDEQRLKLAMEFGATHTLDASVENIGDRCREISAGMGMDVVVDVTNARSLDPFITATDAARPNGRIVLGSAHSGAVTDLQVAAQIQDKTLTVVGVRGRGRKAAAIALDLLADPQWSRTLKRLCDPIVALEDLVFGFEALRDGNALHASMSPSAPRR
jgi:threonine dehydrogenase-like Zn-dependent dehydrogenase